MDKIRNYLKEISGYLCIGAIVLYYGLQFSSIFYSWMKIFLFIGIVFGSLFLLLNWSKKKNIIAFFLLPLIFVLGNFDTRFMMIYILSLVIYIDKDNFLKYFKMLLCINIGNTLFLLIFGYYHINAFAIQFGMDIILFTIIYEKILQKKHIVLLIGMTVAFFLLTDVSQFLICMSLYLLLFLFRDNSYLDKFLKSKVVLFSYVLAALANIIFALYLHDNIFRLPQFLFKVAQSLAMKLDALMNYRLSFTQMSLNIFGFKFFGNVLDYSDPRVQDRFFNVDSGYVQLLQTKGLLIFIFMLVLFSCIIYYFQKKQMYTMIIVSITMAFWGINEDIILSTKVNIMLLYAVFGVKDVLDLIIQKRRRINGV